MAAIDDLKTAITALNDGVTAELAAIATKLESIPAGTSDAAIAEVTASVNAVKDRIAAETAILVPPVVVDPPPPPPPAGPPA